MRAVQELVDFTNLTGLAEWTSTLGSVMGLEMSWVFLVKSSLC